MRLIPGISKIGLTGWILIGLLAGVAIGEPARPLIAFADALSQVMFKVTSYVMWIAPVGVGAAVAVTIGNGGIGALGALARMVLTLYMPRSVSSRFSCCCRCCSGAAGRGASSTVRSEK